MKEQLNHFNSDLLGSFFIENHVIHSPFIHLHKQDAFPRELFIGIKDNFISPDKLIADSEALPANTKYKGARNSFFLSNRLICDIEDLNSQVFWTNFLDESHRTILKTKRLFLNSYNKFIGTKELSIEQTSIAFRFVTEQLPFELKPHVDMPQKLAVAVLFVERTDQQSGGGTQLFSMLRDNSFRLDKNYDFIENSIVLIPREEETWHGGLWEGDCQRKTFHIYFMQHKNSKAALEAREKYRFLM